MNLINSNENSGILIFYAAFDLTIKPLTIKDMRRHPSLIPLSRFHRSILFLALIARKNAPEVKGYPNTLSGKTDYALAFYRTQLKPHFEVEERIWAFFKEKYPALRELIHELTGERTAIHQLFEDLERDPDRLYILGPKLEQHVRREERELFQAIQQKASSSDFEWLDKLLGKQ